MHQVMQDIFSDQSEEEADSENESYHKASFHSDRRLEPEIKETDESKGEAEHSQKSALKGAHHDHLGGSRSTMTQRCKDQDLYRAMLRDLFGDSDIDEPSENDYDGGLELENEGKVESKADVEVNTTCALKGVYHDHLESSRSLGDSKGNVPTKYVVHNRISEENRSVKYKGNHAKELLVGSVLPHEVTSPKVFEIPFRRPLVHPDQMATIKLSNIIGIDLKPLDSNTYVEDEFNVTDASGSKKGVPHTNIIRWRKVRKTDGTTLVESNARFVTWADGSLQLLIGNQAFDVCEHDTQDIQSHLFLRHAKGIYQSQGRISKKIKVVPSSFSSNSHLFSTALAASRHKKVNKVRQYIPNADPERMMEQMVKAERESMKASKHHNNKKRVTEKYRYMDRNEHQLMPGFLSKEKSKESGSKQLTEFDEDTLPGRSATRRLMFYSDDE